jgi:hypothetical protein
VIVSPGRLATIRTCFAFIVAATEPTNLNLSLIASPFWSADLNAFSASPVPAALWMITLTGEFG